MKAPLLSYFGEPKIAAKLLSEITEKTSKIWLKGLVGSSFSIASSATIRESKRPHLFIFTDKEEAQYFVNEVEALLNNEIFFYPASYRRAYQFEETDNANILLRAEVLNKLNNKRNPIIITYSEALSEKVVSRKELKRQTITIQIGDLHEIEQLENQLISHHFEKVDFVIEPGQFSIRGGILDIFSYADEHPFRIEFFDVQVESIRIFDINSQLSIHAKNKINIVPNTEAKKTDSKHVSFLNYLPNNAVIWAKDVAYSQGVLSDYFAKANIHFKSLEENGTTHQIPEDLFTSGKHFCTQLDEYTTIEFGNSNYFDSSKKIVCKTQPHPVFNKQFDLLKANLLANSQKGIKNIILCSSEEQEKRFEAIFENSEEEIQYRCIHFSLHQGFIDEDNRLAVYTDHQLFERYHRFVSKTKFSDKQAITLKQLTNLQIGDFVSHIDHGVGQFSGMHKIERKGKIQELIKLTYKNDDILYLSIHALHKIAKFSGKEGYRPKVHQLGSPQWVKTKNKTKKRVKQIAFDLIKLYAKRKTQKGFAFSQDTYLQHELEASFMYEDTPDQSKATTSLKEDMEKDTPMDRLVCGDVGFGKTEVAIRAAFKAVTDNKQVAILVPTTILALQHFKTFGKRMKDFPCNIDYINRFKTPKEQNETIKKLAKGEIDILIGTHRIVGKDLVFKDLGLMIVDEEQKFGVNIKDKLKALKTTVDTLTLSATPIPRTLQFSLLGARDLSIINTPPPNRQSIETRIIRLNHEVIRDAISYEMSRNGQVFFVHNRIENIKEVAGLVQRLCPDAKIKTGHGQMKGKQIEKLMIGFMEGEFDVLISTTIIENGVDIPNANTIIINNANNFGLSDLHQMRGRVGRSNKKAFCYLISPPTHQISVEARKRLDALEQFSVLGSGFNIAMRDLDIRGAGDLLGADQSGFINDIGFEMYKKILDESVEELKAEKFQDLFENEKHTFYIKDCALDTDLEIMIPEDYVSNVEERLNLYKELNNFTEEKEIVAFEKQLNDRFGALPQAVCQLFDALRLRWLGKEVGFSRIILKSGKMRAYFINDKTSNYFESAQFSKVLNYLKNNLDSTKMKEVNEKLSLEVIAIPTLSKAITFCKKISLNESRQLDQVLKPKVQG
ncbi:MAG: transcription-repair coupling factor [Bacteroidota bacterium]|nr:transcription-repair coupling factor [Bacteroidota bacterium]